MKKKEKDLLLGMYLEAYGGFLTEKQRRAADLYYTEDMSLSEIARETNVSRQGVQDTLKRARRRLYAMEDQLKLIHGTESWCKEEAVEEGCGQNSTGFSALLGESENSAVHGI